MDRFGFIIGIVNILYLTFWFCINKIRNSENRSLRELDNGNEFYESLNASNKESYWKEDTKNLNIFLSILLLFVEFTFVFLVLRNRLWLLILMLGLLISTIVAIIMGIRLKRKYK